MADFTLAPLLRKCSDDDLEPLVKFIKKAELTETLSESYGYCAHYPKHSKYADQIAHHIRLFGGSTPVNIFRGEGPPYKEIVQDVANKLGVDYEYYDSVEELEKKVLKEVVRRASKSGKLSTQEKEDLVSAFERMGSENSDWSAISDIVIGIVGRLILRSVLFRSIFPPLALVLVLTDIAGPAYRVTIPCVCLVACLRLKIQFRDDFGGDE